MLTLKHVFDGSEKIYAADVVIYTPRHATGAGEAAADVSIDTPKGERRAIGAFGRFFVMNEVGKTVAKYDLGGDPSVKTAFGAGLGALVQSTHTAVNNMTATTWTGPDGEIRHS